MAKINLNYRPNTRYLSTGEYFERAAKRIGLEVDGEYEEIILNIESGFPTPFKKGVVTGIYEIDVYQDSGNPHTDQINAADIYFATHFPKRRAEDHVLLPHGFDPELCNIENTGEYDVVLSGSLDGHYSRRNHIYNTVEAEFKCLRVGSGTPTPEYLKQLARAKIILNVTGWKEMNRRVFDGMALGVTLVDACPNNYLLGEAGKHFVTFGNESDIIYKIRSLLEDEQLYNRIRKEGREYAYANHTYDIRLQTAYDKLKEKYDEKLYSSTT